MHYEVLNSGMRRLAVIAFGLTVLLRFGIALATGQLHDLDRTEMERVALSVAATGEYANPYSLPTGPTAHVAPLYPLFLAAIFKCFGTGIAGEAVKQLLACGATGLRSALLVWLAARSGLPRRAVWIIGGLSVVYIGALQTETKGDWEAPYAAVALLLLAAQAWRLAYDHAIGVRTAAAVGAFWGISLLLAPAFAPVLGAWALLAAFRYSPRIYWSRLPVLAAALALVLAPWTLRNWRQLGSPVWGRSNFGLEFAVSNAAGAHWSNPLNRVVINASHPLRNTAAALEVRQQGEIAYNRGRLARSLQWVRENPKAFLVLTAQRFRHFWLPSQWWPLAAVQGVFVLLAAAGLYLLEREHRVLAWLIGSIWFAYPLVYYIIQWSSRYRTPMEWSLLLCAGVACDEVLRRLTARREIPEPVEAADVIF